MLGGFSPADVNPYDQRSPFERSFTIRSDGLVVAIGWPILGGIIQPTLADFRKGTELFHITHKYHVKATDRDNDAFLVLGTVTPMSWAGSGRLRDGYGRFVAALAGVQEEIRESLRTTRLVSEMGREHCCFVRYSTPDLATVPERNILPCEAASAERLRGLYLSE